MIHNHEVPSSILGRATKRKHLQNQQVLLLFLYALLVWPEKWSVFFLSASKFSFTFAWCNKCAFVQMPDESAKITKHTLYNIYSHEER